MKRWPLEYFSVAKVEEEEEMELSFLSTFGVLVYLE